MNCRKDLKALSLVLALSASFSSFRLPVLAENVIEGTDEAAETQAEETSALAGTQKVYVTAEDWGPAVSKTIIHFEKEVDASSVSAADFAVKETKNSAENTRKVLNAYTSDEEGNPVSGNSEYVALELFAGYGVGGPFGGMFANIFGTPWAEQYSLDVTLTEDNTITADGTEYNALAVTAEINLRDDANVLVPVISEWGQDEYVSTDEFRLPYAYYEPAEDSHKNALVIWFHGGGEGGLDPDNILLGAEVTALASDEFQNKFDGAYILAPQCYPQNGGFMWGQRYVEPAYELITKFLEEHPDIDQDRILVGGCSMGGGMTMNMLFKHPDLFAGAYLMCPDESQVNGDYNQNPDMSWEDYEAIKDIPIWFIQAKNDTTKIIEYCAYYFRDKCIEAGNENVYSTIYDDVHDVTGRYFIGEDGSFTTEDTGTPWQYAGHWCWVYFFNNYCTDDESGINMWDWMASLTKKEPLRFVDVTDESKYYYTPVYWAAENGITKGYAADSTFRPQETCTRAQMVTFLWRLAGQPEPAGKDNFKDVKSNQYYYKAVLWAAEQGITKGYSDGTFRPDAKCLREHAVTFLYRYAGKPALKSASNPFNDIKSSDYYYTPALWANQEGIAKGYSSGAHKGGFGPKLDCLREHVVTFLYRYAK